MRALERLPCIAKKKRTGSHEAETGARAVLECTGRNDGNTDIPMPLLEGAILGTVRAEHIVNGPALALSKDAGAGATRHSMLDTPRQSLLEFDRNFPQEFGPANAVKQFHDTDAATDSRL